MMPQSPYTAGEIICAHRKHGLYLVRTNNDIVFEMWCSSNKHPDAIHRFSKWENKTINIDDDLQIYQWLLFIASGTLFPFNAREIAIFAENVYHIFND